MEPRLSDDEGHFIAGFVEGEAHFGIVEANGGQSFRCLMALRVRDDDADLLAWLRARSGAGTLRAIAARATSRPQTQWLVDTQSGCWTLLELLTRFEMRGRKRREFEIWKRAVELWTSGVTNRAVAATRLRRQLVAARQFAPPSNHETVAAPPPEVLGGYLHGLLCAEGSLAVGPSRTSMTLHLRADDRPLLQMLASATEVGRVCDHRPYPPARPSASWQVARLDDVLRLADALRPSRLRGRKAAELEIWLRAVAERRDARAAGRPARLGGLTDELRAAREYRPGRRPASPARSSVRRDEAVRVLRRWAATEPGTLSSGRYGSARRGGWPSRNTIARRFGSWDAALRAAGLADRRALPAPRRAGGAEERALRAAAQRERVLATLRYAVLIHGTLPTATEFFRWRLTGAPATPSQATIYRVFPGGWSAVLDALTPPEPSPAGAASPGTSR